VVKKRSKTLVAGIVVGVLLVAGAGVAGAAKLLSKYDDFVASPIGATPSLPGDRDQVEPTGEPVPDPVVEKENKLYANGKAGLGQMQGAHVPADLEGERPVVLRSADEVHEQVFGTGVEKAGFEFHEPQLIIFDEGQETACGVQEDVASSYCDDGDGGIAMPWQNLSSTTRGGKASGSDR